ncbi:MAG TPA: Xaa-Pro peptidase family protein [Anaerolineae bacterium]|nr:Xaa-Pro peptidase family protein [Anaerolineae bacterium]
MTDRVAQVRGRLRELEIDALLVTQAENRRYLSGFTGSAGVLLITLDRSILATDSRYWEQAAKQAPTFELVQIKTRLEDHLADILGKAGYPKRVGFESAAVSVDQFSTWSNMNGGVVWVATKNAVEPIRAVKDESELAAIRKAAAVTDAGFDFLCGVLKPGMTEREAAWELEAFLRTHGAEALAFDVIVASGPDSAMAHHHPGDRAIQAGEPILIDFGAKVDGYCADLTRTVSLGRADEKYDEVYEIVRRAQQVALDGMRAGMPGVQADALAREAIVAAGYGDFFGHGLGHGVGLAVHEAPRAGRVDAEAPLPVGATLTVEPGVYLAGWGGVRIEDLVVVRENGVEALSRAHKRSII